MSLNSMRKNFHHSAGWIMGVVTVAMVAVSFTGLGAILNGSRGPTEAKPQSSSDIVATVNGMPISRASFDQWLQNQENRMEQQYQQPPPSPLESAQLRANVLNDLTQRKLAVQQAMASGLTATPDEIDHQRLVWAKQQNIAQVLGLSANASVADIDSKLEMNGNQTLEQMQPDDDLRDDVIMTKLLAAISGKIVVTEQDARNSYQQYHTQHILVDNKKRSDVEAQRIAQDLLKKAQAPGADFSALARQSSDDPGTKAKGGDDSWIDQSTSYVPEFKDAAFKLKPGEVTLIKSPTYGYFLIKLDAIRSNLPKDFDKNKANYINTLKQQRISQAEQDYFSRLTAATNNKIVISDPELRADKAMTDLQMQVRPNAPLTPDQKAQYEAVVADYKKALSGSPSYKDVNDINTQLGLAYQALGQTTDAINAFQAAIKGSGSADVMVKLGDLYEKAGKTDLALAQYKAASTAAWDSPMIHFQLQQSYTAAHHPELAAEESQWMKTYEAKMRAEQSPPSVGSAPAGVPAGSVPIHIGGTTVSVKPNGAKPTPISVKVAPQPAGTTPATPNTTQ